MSDGFNICDPSTWPEIMTADEVAAVFRRKVGGVIRSIQLGRFVPTPIKGSHPFAFRKSDVLRIVRPA